jgi:hypothetical protein
VNVTGVCVAVGVPLLAEGLTISGCTTITVDADAEAPDVSVTVAVGVNAPLSL